MKAGRNDLCPCGSGKKYKRCCLPKEREINRVEPWPEEPENAHGLSEVYEDEEIGFLFDVVSAFHKFMLSQKPHIKEYNRIRKMHGEILESMMEYCIKNKFEPKPNADISAQFLPDIDKVLALVNLEFDLETNEGKLTYGDILVYKNFPAVNCITEEYINSKRFKKPEKVEFLQSMLDSRAGLFKVTKVEPGEGYAYLEEVFNGAKFKITDIGLSGSSAYDLVYLYTRIITYRGVSLNAGLNLVIPKTDPFIKNFIKNEKKNYKPLAEILRFVELYNRFSMDPNRVIVENK